MVKCFKKVNGANHYNLDGVFTLFGVFPFSQHDTGNVMIWRLHDTGNVMIWRLHTLR
jgi:hypothetical protein